MKHLAKTACALLAVAAGSPPVALGQTDNDARPPALPAAPVLLVGDPAIDASAVLPYVAPFAMGRAAARAELETAGAFQDSRVERVTVEGRELLRRRHEVRRAGAEDVLMRATIDMDPRTLKPLRAEMEQGGGTVVVDYDWERFVLRRTPGSTGAEFDEVALDLEMFEVGAHDVWMAALPLAEGFVGRLPAVFAATGTKYWAVPRVVGSERVDLGSNGVHDAWVVALDWWGMGAADTVENHSIGGRPDGTAGPGGKYWVLKKARAGVPGVVRVRTEIGPDLDSVVELRAAE